MCVHFCTVYMYMYMYVVMEMKGSGGRPNAVAYTVLAVPGGKERAGARYLVDTACFGGILRITRN